MFTFYPFHPSIQIYYTAFHASEEKGIRIVKEFCERGKKKLKLNNKTGK